MAKIPLVVLMWTQTVLPRHADRFGELIKGYMASDPRDYREVAREAGLHYTSLYQWSNGNPPATLSDIRTVGRVLGLSASQVSELVESAQRGRDEIRRTAKVNRLVSGLVDITEEAPDAVTYDPDLEDADLMALLEQAHPGDRNNILRAAKAYLSEVRRRR